MGLSVRLVHDLAEVVDPLVDFLSVDTTQRGIFAVDHLIVPTEGVRAWLNSELVKRLGTSSGGTDGVVANVQIGYVGSLTRYVAPDRFDGEDAWSIDHVTMLILNHMAGRPEFQHLSKRHGGLFAAARHLADRFDRYHARRPQMIALWDQEIAVLAPTTRNQVLEGERMPDSLQDQLWQYEVWRSVRNQIGVASWPTRIAQLVDDVRQGVSHPSLPSRLMVVGLQSLSLSAIELLKALGEVGDVQVLLVHPSPALATHWRNEYAGNAVTPGVIAERQIDMALPIHSDPLVASWLRSSREMQQMLASQGVRYDLHHPKTPSSLQSLLSRIKSAVANGGTDHQAQPPSIDFSVQIHRCYNITRQVEVVHEAILHAFTDIPDLHPHEVVIYSPQINQIAPILSAVFERPLVREDGTQLNIPLRVADRSLRDVSTDIELLSNLLELLIGRYSVDSFLKVATAEPVTRHLRIADDQRETWTRTIERTKVRWGIDADERRASGLDTPQLHSYSWRQAIERALLGATLPDGDRGIELGQIVPLSDVGTSEIDDLLSLLHIFDAIDELDRLTHDEHGVTKGATRSLVQWCDAVEKALYSLCGDEENFENALFELDVLKQSALVPMLDGSVNEITAGISFADFARVLLDRLGGSASHPPLRSGAVTATSFVPLRGVPFRVVCIVGIDDGVIGGTEAESDDIISFQQLVGDADPRVDGRRQLLDAVLAANDRVIITCNGRSITNNTIVPLTTSLSELVDLCVRLGVSQDREMSAIEYSHPRHHNSTRNFVMGGVVPGRVWSHDHVARQSALQAGQVRPEPNIPKASITQDVPQSVDIDDLARFQNEPLQEFLRNTMGIHRYIEAREAIAAVMPLDPEADDFSSMVLDVLNGQLTKDFDLADYFASVRESGILPVGAYGDVTVKKVTTLVRSITEEMNKNAIPVQQPPLQHISCQLTNGVRITGNITRHHDKEQILSHIRISKNYKRDVEQVAMQLLMLAGLGSATRSGYTIHLHSTKANTAQVRKPKLHQDIDVATAHERLTTLEELRRLAQVTPFPRFGDTVKDLFGDSGQLDFDKARKKFRDFVNGSSYVRSNEAMVYGREPRFESIFVDGGEVVRFWQRLHDAAPYGAGGISRKYEVQ